MPPAILKADSDMPNELSKGSPMRETPTSKIEINIVIQSTIMRWLAADIPAVKIRKIGTFANGSIVTISVTRARVISSKLAILFYFKEKF